MADAEIAVIGGSGLYDTDMLEDAKEISAVTPFGAPSDAIIVGAYKGKRVAFLPRHGRGHKFPAHLVNYRANIWALKQLGVKRILASNACGSLQEHFRPGELVLVDQFIDRTKSRASSFYEGKAAVHLREHGLDRTCHISMADPFCHDLRFHLAKVAQQLNLPFHTAGTYVCIDGPRFSTRAESRLFRAWGGDVIGMTVFPECVLAREAGMCYAAVALVTDYDVWAERPVELNEVLRVMGENSAKARRLFAAAIESLPEPACKCKEAIKTALI
ncbi:MAG: S-methyl-5'-thioadenosine phosphorylase [Candidatus Aenigmatarchaeota archaeon]